MGLILSVAMWLALGCAAVTLLRYWLACYQSTKPVIVEGLQLPQSIVRASWQGGCGLFIVKRPQDAYGSFWEPGVLNLLSVQYSSHLTPAAIERLASEERMFARASDTWAIDPGFISYITDFSQIISIGEGSMNAPVCLDFREDSREPSVICWNDFYWRRVAPNFASFLALLEPREFRRQRDWHPAAAPGAQATGCVSVALAAAAPYDIWDWHYDVLVYVIYSRALAPTVVFLPCSRGSDQKGEPPPEWRVQVSVPQGQVIDPRQPEQTRASVTTSGAVRLVERGSPQWMLGQAVLAACKYQVEQSGGPGLQGFVRASRLQGGVRDTQRCYLIHCGDVSRALDAHINYRISEGLTEITSFW